MPKLVNNELSEKEKIGVETTNYTYRRSYPVAVMILLTLLPAMALILICGSLGVQLSQKEDPLIFAALLPIIVMLIAPIVWGISTLKTKINIDNDGLVITRLWKKIKINWKDVIGVEKVAIFSSTFPTYGPPQDLQIILRNKKKLNIYFFLAGDNNTSSAIDELQQLIVTKCQKHDEYEGIHSTRALDADRG